MQKNKLLPIYRFMSRQRFLYRNSVFWPCVVSMGLFCNRIWLGAGVFGSRHGFPCVATWFSVLSYRKCHNRFGLAWGSMSR